MPTPDLQLRAVARSHVGLVRQGNEDSGYAGHHVFVVADGMGGQVAGEVASRTVVAAMLDLDTGALGPDLVETMRQAVRSANRRLRVAITARPDLEGMGTTLTALAWDGARLGLAHVGDSRAYLQRGDSFARLTHDQTLVQSLIDDGQLTEEAARSHPQRAVILQALDGRREEVDAEVTLLDPALGDRFLLCSDGLTGYVPEVAVSGALTDPHAGQALDRLIQLALDAGAPDNVTVVLVDVVAAESPAPEPTSAESDSPAPGGILVGAVGETGAAALRLEATEPPESEAPPSRPATATGPVNASTADPIAAEALDEEQPRRRRWPWVIAALIVLLLLAVSAGLAARSWATDQWYVGVDNGNVAVFSGVDVTVGPFSLSSVDHRTTIEVVTLPEFAREEVEGGIAAADAEDADEIVARLQATADGCLAAPQTSGCP